MDTTALTSVECSICKDTLVDPRSLPCGHSFCGPPKLCLKAVEKPRGLKCAICKQDIDLNVDQLKPLYGIRTFLRQSTSRQQNDGNEKKFEVLCEKHAGCSVEFWCETCKEEACMKCFNSVHQKHALVVFREHLKNITAPIFSEIDVKVKATERLASKVLNATENLSFMESQREEVFKQVRFCLGDLNNFKTTLRSIGEFIEDSQIDIDLNQVKKFASRETPDDLESILKELTFLRARTSADFKLVAEFTSNLDGDESKELRSLAMNDEKMNIKLKLRYDPHKSELHLETALSTGEIIPAGRNIPGEMPYFCEVYIATSTWRPEKAHAYHFTLPCKFQISMQIPETLKTQQVQIKLKYKFILNE